MIPILAKVDAGLLLERLWKSVDINVSGRLFK